MACRPIVTTETFMASTAVTQLSTSYSTSINPAATSSCIRYVRTSTQSSHDDDGEGWGDWGEWGGGRDDDNGDGDGDRGNGRPGFWNQRRRHQARSEAIARHQKRQRSSACATWSTFAATRTEQVIMTRTSWSVVPSTEVWTISPKCGDASRTEASIVASPTNEALTRTALSSAPSTSASPVVTSQNNQPSTVPSQTAAATSATSSTASTNAVTTAETTYAQETIPQSVVQGSYSKTASSTIPNGLGMLTSSTAEATAIGTVSATAASSATSDDGRLTDDGRTTQIQAASGGKDPNRIAGIAAGTIGGVAAALLILAVLVWWQRRRAREKETTLIFASEIATPVPMEKDDYPRSIASHSTRPLLPSRFSQESSRYSRSSSMHLFGRRWTGAWFRPVSGFGSGSGPTSPPPPVPPIPPILLFPQPSPFEHERPSPYHYERTLTGRASPDTPIPAVSLSSSTQARPLQRSGTRVTLTPADDEEKSTRTLSLSGLSATSLAYHMPDASSSKDLVSESDVVDDTRPRHSRREGSWDRSPIWKEILQDHGPVPIVR